MTGKRQIRNSHSQSVPHGEDNHAHAHLDSDFDDDAPLYEVDDDMDDDLEGDETVETYLEEATEDSSFQSGPNKNSKNKRKHATPLRVMFSTMLTPVEGWKKLKRSRFTTEQFASGCFYPMIALATVTEICKVFYEPNHTLGEWVLDGLLTFLAFFFGYFTVLLLGGIVLPVKSRDLLKTEIGRQFVMLNLSTLAIFWSVINLIPMLDPVLVFLPIWTIYLIYKGVRVLRVSKEVENSTTGFLCLLILGAPLLWNWLLTDILLPIAFNQPV